jgi:alkaline phosphatase D
VESRHDALVLPDGVFKNGSSGAKYANTLADYRYLYKKYRTDTRLQALHERFAFIAIWDDHEFTDDAWQDAQTYDGSFNADGSDLHQTSRRRSQPGLVRIHAGRRLVRPLPASRTSRSTAISSSAS